MMDYPINCVKKRLNELIAKYPSHRNKLQTTIDINSDECALNPESIKKI